MGDKRLAKRLVDSAHVQAEEPRAPFSVAAGGNMATVTGFYRLSSARRAGGGHAGKHPDAAQGTHARGGHGVLCGCRSRHLERTEYVPFEPNLHGSGMSFPEALNLVIEALDEWPGLFVEDRTKGRGENAGPLIT